MANVNQYVFRDVLEALDVRRAFKLWREVAPHLPQPKNDNEMLVQLHYARTLAESINIRRRYYSHRWLEERSLPSGLPENLKPEAERIFPKIVTAVGISVNSMSSAPLAIQLAQETERVMSAAVAECYADGVTDPEIVKARMREARERL